MQKNVIRMISIEMRILSKGEHSELLEDWEKSEIVFRAIGKTADEASESVQLQAYKDGWTHENCSAWARGIKQYYKGFLIGRIIQIW